MYGENENGKMAYENKGNVNEIEASIV